MEGWQVFVEVPGKPPLELALGESVIGRSRACAVHIPESTVSRHHAKLVVTEGGKVTVADMGSSNGTFVNGDKVEGGRALANGDRVVVGEAEVIVRILPPVEPSDVTMKVSIPAMTEPAPGSPAAIAAERAAGASPAATAVVERRRPRRRRRLLCLHRRPLRLRRLRRPRRPRRLRRSASIRRSRRTCRRRRPPRRAPRRPRRRRGTSSPRSRRSRRCRCRPRRRRGVASSPPLRSRTPASGSDSSRT
ncbi:MAG: FHA domain-containing protein [Holophagales bacterium]|nr:FHA domain-containing protein [Holophagales bacterium]